jgi:hypothetical protein
METVVILLAFTAASMFLLYIKDTAPEQLSSTARRFKAVSKYIVAMSVATFGAAASAALVALPLLAYSRFTHTTSGENLFSVLLDRPYFPLQVVAAVVIGYFTANALSEGWPTLVWVLPLFQAVAGIAVLSRRHSALQGTWEWMSQTFLNWGCGCSASLLQWELMLPVYTSFAFAIGVLIRRMLTRDASGKRSNLSVGAA